MLRPHTHRRRQGDLGEANAIEWLTRCGANVLVPLFHSPDYDLVADRDGVLLRIQVKTSTSRRNGRYVVAVCTRGGNRSGKGSIKRFDGSRCDCVFVLVADGRRWLLPARALGGRTSILLGGPRYERYAVDDGGDVDFLSLLQ